MVPNPLAVVGVAVEAHGFDGHWATQDHGLAVAHVLWKLVGDSSIEGEETQHLAAETADHMGKKSVVDTASARVVPEKSRDDGRFEASS